MQLPLVPYYETCDEDGPCAPYFTGHITDADGRVMCRTDSEERAIELVDCVDGLSANIEALRARLAEVEAQRDGLKTALVKIRDYTPYRDYNEHDEELFAKRAALAQEIKNCGECQYAKQVKWPQSGLCPKHYSPFMRLEDMITTMHDNKQMWAPHDIAREALAKLEEK